MWFALAGAAVIVAALVLRRLLGRSSSSEIDVGNLSQSWLADLGPRFFAGDGESEWWFRRLLRRLSSSHGQTL
jgi:hypothetical protein